jgi:hypothetical protein
MNRIKSFDQFIFEAESTTKGNSLTVPVGGTFASGEFTIKNSKPLDEKMPEILAFLKKYPVNQKVEVKVEAMESQVPNRGVGLKPGELAQKRTEAMLEFLKEKLKDLPNVIITAAPGKIGPTPWNPEKGDKADDEKFTNEQRVDIVIKPIGEQITITPAGGKEEFSFAVPYDGSPKDGETWSIARFGTWSFSVKDKDVAKEAYDFLTKGGATNSGGFDRGQKKEGYTFFPSKDFRTFDSIKDFKEFFSKYGDAITYIEKKPDYFFQMPSDNTNYGFRNPKENGLRPLWKTGSGVKPKDRTL